MMHQALDGWLEGVRSRIERTEDVTLTLTGIDPPVLTKTDPLISQKDCFL